jgi:hypothetical protein
MHVHRLVKRNIQKRIDKNIILKCIYEICLFQLWTNNNNFNNFREGTASLASLVDTPHQTRTIELLIINAQVSMSEFYLENFFFFYSSCYFNVKNIYLCDFIIFKHFVTIEK